MRWEEEVEQRRDKICQSWLTQSPPPSHPLTQITHVLSPLSTHEHVQTHIRKHSSFTERFCSSAWGGPTGSLGSYVPSLCTQMYLHTFMGARRSCCVRRALILHVDDERQAAGLLSQCQRARPERADSLSSSSASSTFIFIELISALTAIVLLLFTALIFNGSQLLFCTCHLSNPAD